MTADIATPDPADPPYEDTEPAQAGDVDEPLEDPEAEAPAGVQP